MRQWMLYVFVVSVVLTLAAVAAERALRLCGRTTRGVWVTALIASLAVPTIIASVSIGLPSIAPGLPGSEVALRNATSLPLSLLSQLPWSRSILSPSGTRVSARLDTLLGCVWLVTSSVLLLLACLSALQLALRARAWARATVADLGVRVSPDGGPAVVGWLHPRIVLPQWVLGASASCQAHVIAHQQSHIRARDPLLLALARALLVLMPWNLPLWWQVRQLQRAIEVDCDARVLQAGHDVACYGETLLKVAARRPPFTTAMAALSESPAFLKQRLAIMARGPVRGAHGRAALLGCLSLALSAVAVQVRPPNASLPGRTDEAVVVNPAVYDRYAGQYRFKSGPLMSVSRAGDRLITRMVGQLRPVEAFPRSATDYFARDANAQIRFQTDAKGRAVALTLYQDGQRFRALRMDARAVQQVQARVASQRPDPGSRAALIRYYSALLAGKLDYRDMTPELAAMTRQRRDPIRRIAARFGAIESVQFRGVGAQGRDVYDIHHARGITTWRIEMAADGKIAHLTVQAGL